jgi:hypothetical protein
MEAIVAASRIETDLTRRIEHLQDRINLIKSPYVRRISTGSAEVSVDWNMLRDVVTAANNGNMFEAYRLFCEMFEAEIAQRADKSALREKADRLFVDSVLRNVEFYVKDEFLNIVNVEFTDVRGEINVIRNMISTVRDHSTEQIAAIRKQLNRIKKGVPEKTNIDLLDPEKRRDIQKETKPWEKSVEASPIRQPVARVRTGYRKRSAPYIPQEMEVVSGLLIKDIERRSSFEQQSRRNCGYTRNSRYTLPL